MADGRQDDVGRLRRRLGRRLAGWRHAAGLTQDQLAARVAYSRASIAGAEAGTQQAGEEFWRRCDDALAVGGDLLRAWHEFVDARNERARVAAVRAAIEREERVERWRLEHAAQPAPDGAAEGLEYALSWRDGVDHLIALWSLDMDRRQLLLRAGFSAVAFSTPAIRWMTGEADDRPTAAGGRSVGMREVETVRRMTSVFRGLDNRFGGGHARTAVVAYLHADVAPLLTEGRYGERVGRALLGAVAELTQLVGWMAYDTAQHGLAQRYLIQALRLAKAAGHGALGAEILCGMSHQAVYLGRAAEGIDLARAAAQSADAGGVPALLAEASVMEARGHALRKDGPACARCLGRAERAFERSGTADHPRWLSYFDEAYLAAKFAHCFRDLDRPHEAERYAVRSLDMDRRYVRGEAFNTALLASVYAQQGHIDQACATGERAVELTRDLRSTRALEYLDTLTRLLRPHRTDSRVQALAAAAAALPGRQGSGTD